MGSETLLSYESSINVYLFFDPTLTLTPKELLLDVHEHLTKVPIFSKNQVGIKINHSEVKFLVVIVNSWKTIPWLTHLRWRSGHHVGVFIDGLMDRGPQISHFSQILRCDHYLALKAGRQRGSHQVLRRHYLTPPPYHRCGIHRNEEPQYSQLPAHGVDH